MLTALLLVATLDSGLAIVPRPVRFTPRTGTFTLTAATVIVTDRGTRELGGTLADYLFPATGYRLAVRASAPAGTRVISLGLDTTLKALRAEGYRLEVTPARVTIRALRPAGAFYAMRTLRERLPPATLREAQVTGTAWRMPAVSIEDYPRFTWRGMHLDVGRHFMPKEFVKKYIDLLALHKMNRFHWHLTEDQGWRIEIKQYPRLAEVGAWRGQTIIGRPDDDSTKWRFDGQPHGGYYTQDDIREVVAYAQARFVTIVPEIEMPGHSQAAIAAYPELGNTGDTLSPWTSRGVDEDELQSWFTRRMDEFLTAHGRSLIGWDEILQGGLAPNATVMSWRGTDGGIAAARAGHDVVMAPTSHTYFDYYQVADTTREPLAIGGFLPLDTVYAFEPVPPTLTPAEARHILGGQGQVWTEYMPDPKRVEYMTFPRVCALAEVLWTPREGRDYGDFVRRLPHQLERLAVLDVQYRPLQNTLGTTTAEGHTR